ncbi:MAG: PD-(D/E)XK nuclease family protein [Gammaproteobacteria bacterium]|nr:PD-(D/E)XK nuclease family protein [Gammaproteobacteria bacterium]
MTTIQSMVNAITHVTQAYEASAMSINERAIVDAVRHVSSVTSSHLDAMNRGYDVQSRTLSQAVVAVSHPVLDANADQIRVAQSQEQDILFPYLRAVQRQYDENLHSDIIASLLSTRLSGQFALALVARIIEATHVDRSLGVDGMHSVQSALREVRLDKLQDSLKGTELGARRIDILVQNASYRLLIENKLLSSESDNQTKDYYCVMQEASRLYDDGRHNVYVFLTPTGSQADCPQFKALSYLQLYSILKDMAKDQSISNPNRELSDFYTNELYQLFMRPRMHRLVELQQRRKM